MTTFCWVLYAPDILLAWFSILRHHISPKYLQSIHTEKSFELLTVYVLQHMSNRIKEIWLSYIPRAFGDSIWLISNSAVLGPPCMEVMFEEANHLGYNTVTGQVVSNNSKGSNSLDCPGFILRWEHVPHQPWGPPCLLYRAYLISFPGVKQPGHGVDHPHLTSTTDKLGRVITLPPSVSLMACYGLIFTSFSTSASLKMWQI